jgi:hypothetical protein
MPAIVMSRKDQGLVGKRKDFVGDGIVLFDRITTSEVAATSAMNEDGITGKDSVVRVQTDPIRSMAGSVKDAQANVADRDHLAIFNVYVNVRGRSATMHDDRGTGQLVQLPTGRAMVRMCVGVDDGIERAAVVGKNGKITLDFLPHRVDQHRFAGTFTSNEIGFAFSTIEFTKQHDFSPFLAQSASCVILDNAKILPKT